MKKYFIIFTLLFIFTINSNSVFATRLYDEYIEEINLLTLENTTQQDCEDLIEKWGNAIDKDWITFTEYQSLMGNDWFNYIYENVDNNENIDNRTYVTTIGANINYNSSYNFILSNNSNYYYYYYTRNGYIYFGKYLYTTDNSRYSFLGYYVNNELIMDNNNINDISGSGTPVNTYELQRIINIPFPTLKYNISINNTYSSSIFKYMQNPSGTEFDENTQITLNGTINDYHYTFDGWYNGTTLLSSNLNYTHTLTNDITITPKLTYHNYYSLNIDNDYTSDIFTYTKTPSNTNYLENTSITLTGSINDSNYTFLGWYRNDILLSSNLTYTFNINSDLNIKPKLQYNPPITYYDLIINNNYDSDIVEITQNPSGTSFEEGTSILLSVDILDSNYSFNGWYYNDTLISSLNPYAFYLNSDTNLTLKLDYTEPTTQYNFNVVNDYVNIFDYVQDPTGNIFDENTELTLTGNILNYNYTFLGWYENDTLLSDDLEYTFILDRDLQIKPKLQYNAIIYNLTINNNNTNKFTYSINPSGTSFSEGTQITLTGTMLDNQYVFDGWYDQYGNLLSSNLTYTFNINSNITITPRVSLSQNFSISAVTGFFNCLATTSFMGSSVLAWLLCIFLIGFVFNIITKKV